MNRIALRFVATISLLFVFAIVGFTQTAGLFTEAQAQRGQTLYAAKCASCHGQSLEGATPRRSVAVSLPVNGAANP